MWRKLFQDSEDPVLGWIEASVGFLHIVTYLDDSSHGAVFSSSRFSLSAKHFATVVGAQEMRDVCAALGEAKGKRINRMNGVQSFVGVSLSGEDFQFPP